MTLQLCPFLSLNVKFICTSHAGNIQQAKLPTYIHFAQVRLGTSVQFFVQTVVLHNVLLPSDILRYHEHFTGLSPFTKKQWLLDYLEALVTMLQLHCQFQSFLTVFDSVLPNYRTWTVLEPEISTALRPGPIEISTVLGPGLIEISTAFRTRTY